MKYDGVVITDALFMKAVHERWGHAWAAVMALQAGADMPLAQGSKHEQSLAVQAIEAALREGDLLPEQVLRAQARLQALARRFPVAPRAYPSDERAADDLLMRQAWARGLRTLGDATPPALDQPLEVVTQASVASDGVSEAGVPADRVAALFARHADVHLRTVPDLTDPAALESPPGDTDRLRVLVSNQRRRYPAAAAGWAVDLHLVLWNPFQAEDIAAPALVSWGHAEGALDAVSRWLAGELEAGAGLPVPLGIHLRPAA